jgi:hypothetical protein
MDPVDPTAQDPPPAGLPPLALGASVRLVERQPYLKTAEPMPMLRPPDLVDEGELGEVVGVRALDTLAVRFRRGTFLLAASALQPALPA